MGNVIDIGYIDKKIPPIKEPIADNTGIDIGIVGGDTPVSSDGFVTDDYNPDGIVIENPPGPGPKTEPVTDVEPPEGIKGVPGPKTEPFRKGHIASDNGGPRPVKKGHIASPNNGQF